MSPTPKPGDPERHVSLVRLTYLEQAASRRQDRVVPFPVACRYLTALACCLLTVGCLGSGGPPGLPGKEVLGARTSTPLTLAAAAVTPAVKISRSAAMKSVEHPYAAPQLAGGLKQFGLARVTVTALAAEGTGPPPTYHDNLAWVGIYEISKSGGTSCPGEPAPVPTNLPPVFAHYYFAVLVDATTGTQTTWNEDMSGLLLRECAGLPTG